MLPANDYGLHSERENAVLTLLQQDYIFSKLDVLGEVYPSFL